MLFSFLKFQKIFFSDIFLSFIVYAESHGLAYFLFFFIFSKKFFKNYFLKFFVLKEKFQKKIILFSIFIFILFSCQAQIILIDQSKKLCDGDSVIINVFNIYSNYKWSNGESTSQIKIKHEGTYSVTVTDVDGKNFTGSILVPLNSNPPPPIIQGTAFICPNGFTTLFVDDIYADVHWSNGISGLQNTINVPGNYAVTVIDQNGCMSTSTDTVRSGNVFPSKLPRSITLCEKDSIVLDATVSGALNYYWNTDDTTASITVRDSGMYNVFIRNGQCVSYDTTFINAVPSPHYTLGNDTSICANDTIILRIPKNESYYYQWQNNAHDTFFVVKDSGLYILRVSLGSCDTTLRKHVSVFNYQSKIPILDTSVCSVPFRIIPQIPDVRAYKWFNGSTNTFLDVTQSGKYNLLAYNKKCYTDVNYIVTVLDTPKIDLGPDTIVCVSNSPPNYTLKYNPILNTSYLWSTGETAQSINVNFSGLYYLFAGNKCGRSKTSVNVKFDYCDYVFIPNAFSPNDDGNNDVLQLYPTYNVEKIIQFQIYNRFGVLVFDAGSFDVIDAPQHAWTGKLNSGFFPNDVYIYQLLFQTREGKIYQEKGDITLLK